MAHTVFRSDLMSGTDVAADLVSLKFYDATDEVADVDNGTIVKLVELDDSREVYKAVAATAADVDADIAIVGSEEVMYDERMKNLDEFTNEAGTIARGYIPRARNVFSVTVDGFKDAVAPAKVGDEVGIAEGKLDAAGTGFGKVIAIEVTGRYTYYVIKIA